MKNKEDVWGKDEAKIMNAVLPNLPSRDGFVISLRDFGSQNIMVDDQGNVTGLIDWDLAQTMPRHVGYARYPGWITRDWDPLMYGWPKMTDTEDSPGTLDAYRAHYNKELGRALNWKGDWDLTDKPRFSEAAWIAAMNWHNRLEICRKLVQVVVGEDVSATQVLYDIGVGDHSENDWAVLETKLRELVR